MLCNFCMKLDSLVSDAEIFDDSLTMSLEVSEPYAVYLGWPEDQS
jgi:hypothetical protein